MNPPGVPGERPLLSRRTLVKSLALAPFAGLLPASCGRGDDPPDIVFLVADSLRARSLPFHGYPRQTAPFLSGLAREATIFSRCYSSATWTRPAVTGILSGLTPLEHRQWEFRKAFPSEVASFPKLLAEAGYQTGFFTANHAIGEGYGMEGHFQHVDHGAALDSDFGERLTRDAFRWLEGLTDSPVFAYVHYFPPHGPYDPPAELLARIRSLEEEPEAGGALDRQIPISLGNSSMGRIPWYQALPHFSTRVRTYVDRYDASILFADSLLRGFMERWERLGRGRRTVFIITSDHGECLWEHDHWFDHGRMLADEILHVPLLIVDRGAPRRRVVEHPVSHLDLGATILGLAGVVEGGGLRGLDVLAHRGLRRLADRVVLSQEAVGGQESGWSVLQGRWRLVYNDCPRDGVAAVMAVSAGEPPARSERRVPLSRPEFTGRGAVALAPGVVLESAFVDVPYPTVDEEARVQLRVRAAAGTSGRLALRWRRGTAAAGTADVPVVAEAGENVRTHRLPLPSPSEDRGEHGQLLTLQGRWHNETADEGWLDLLTFHRFARRQVAEGLDLLGVVLTPAVPVPGESVRLSYVWEVSAMPSPHVTVRTTLRKPDGAAVLDRQHRFYGGDPEERTPKPLIEKWRLRSYSFEGRRFRFEESYWVTLPPGLGSEAYTMEVSVLQRRPGSRRLEEAGPPRAVATVVPGSSPAEVLRRTMDSGRGLDGCQALWRMGRHGRLNPARAAELSPLLADLRGRYPVEGHLDYVRWLASGGESTRELVRCLEKTPWHRDALEAATAEGVAGDDGRQTLALLTPPRRCDFRFGHLARLYGFRLERSPDRAGQLYLGLHWEALSSSPVTLAVECSVLGRGGAGQPDTRSSTWWFIGGTRRPSVDWCIGEALVETVRLPLMGTAAEAVEVSLRVTERWEFVYSDNRHAMVVPASEGDGGASLENVRLGSFTVAELPVAERDYLTARRRDPAFLRLHDLTAAVPDAVNLVGEHPEVVERLSDALETLLLAAEHQGQGDSGEEGEPLPEETRKKLRALGYVA